MASSINIALGERPPMPPEDADFSIFIEFSRGEGDPARVFDAISTLIRGLQQIDQTAVTSIDSSINTLLLLEDIEAGSIRVWLRNLISGLDDEAIKDLDWKKAVGAYLVKAKYASLRWLDSSGSDYHPSLEELTEDLQAMAEETEIRQLPDYSAPDRSRLIGGLETIQSAKERLLSSDKLVIETDDQTYELDLAKTWHPAEHFAVEKWEELESEVDDVLTVRKPDMLGNAMWQFRRRSKNLSAKVSDSEWLKKYHSRRISVLPGDSLRCRIHSWHTRDQQGQFTDEHYEVVKVYEVVPGPPEQSSLFDGDLQ